MTFAFTIQMCGWLIGVPLQFMLLAALLRGAYKRFPFLFLYATVSLLTTSIEIPARTQAAITGSAEVMHHFARIYWVDEWILQVLMFALVISLLWEATSNMASRRLVRTSLIAATVLIAAVSFLYHYSPQEPNFGKWMTPWTRDLNFSAAVIDLALWASLVASRSRDPRLLLLSGALGMQFTGEAIGEAIRNMSIAQTIGWVSDLGSVVTMVADLTCLYVWWRTFAKENTAGEGCPKLV